MTSMINTNALLLILLILLMFSNAAHNAINRQAAEESLVLLKNDKQTLPLVPSSFRHSKAMAGLTLGLVGFQSNNAGILRYVLCMVVVLVASLQA